MIVWVRISSVPCLMILMWLDDGCVVVVHFYLLGFL
jgi:hypothetical protein